MAGETAEDVERDERGNPLRRSDEFLSKTKWQRFQVLIMGPVMNILLAIIVLAGVLTQGSEVPLYRDQPPVIGVVSPESPAAAAGIQAGDRIVSVADKPTSTWDDF